jgi:hypothetical protein
MQLRRVAFSIFLLTLSLYILFPTADEIIIHPLFGLFLSQVFNLPLVYGVLLSIVIYRGVGVACLLSALLIGGKPIYYKLKERLEKKQGIKKKKNQNRKNK